ncbi:hypothetical protein BDQ12DRAFT_708903 [Crucibulum laeve]|uniref:Ketoreductase (KR) domain-containing protein n=1 Tax=Crucibulum laeve TaxID=68775 RepID=A0A5C3MKG1_9AGAR|nr:hypothetical protein BDQ12DRAFT_708903 [Crucibulum laeve]
MVLGVVDALARRFFPTQYIVHILVGFVVVVALRAFSQGKRTNRERDLHARTILVTGGFTPLGLILLHNLAARGAHIIALSPYPVSHPRTSILVELLRSTTSNEHIFAEHADLTSPSSIRRFCTKFLTGDDQRLDAVVFSHEYRHIGAWRWFRSLTSVVEEEDKQREGAALATFLITTLLLPALLVAPVERDIRIVNVVNPFYAAAASSVSVFSPAMSVFSPSTLTPKPQSKSKSKPLLLAEGTRSLRTLILSRHLQRILDSLPAAQVPPTVDGTSAVPVVSSKAQKSNIVAVSVSPGISRVDTVAQVLNADWTLADTRFSYFGVFLYIILQPFLRIFTKSPTMSVQSVLHVLFLPTPFKILAQTAFSTSDDASANAKDKPASKVKTPLDAQLEMPEEVLKPGALYAECAVVMVRVPVPADPSASTPSEPTPAPSEKAKKAKGKDNDKAAEEPLPLSQDDEYGGELVGRLVWEAYEGALKEWEAADPNPVGPEEEEVPKEAREQVKSQEEVKVEEEKNPY